MTTEKHENNMAAQANALESLYGKVFSQKYVKPGEKTIMDISSSKDVDTYKAKLSAALLGGNTYPAVHGVGIGLLEDTNRECVRIYIDIDMVKEASDILQPFIKKELPADMKMKHQVPVSPDIVLEIVRARRAMLSTGELARETIRRKVKAGPARGDVRPSVHRCVATQDFHTLLAGVSVWKKGASAKGTIAYFCEDDDDNRYLLTCNHVIADYASGRSLPRKRDIRRDSSGSNTVSIARLSEFVPLASLTERCGAPWNYVDAALATISSAIRPLVAESGIINGIVCKSRFEKRSLGVNVQKHGLATCLTEGTIDDRNCNIKVLGSNGRAYYFVNQIRVVPSGNTKVFASSGDSGSLVFTADGREAVGLLFAAGRPEIQDVRAGDLGFAFVNPIGTVLKCLERRLIDRHGKQRKNLRLITAVTE